MARRRMIDPNFWTSEDVSNLTIRQRLLLIGLFSNSDDHGKGKGKAAAIRSAIFTYDDISLLEIESDLNELSKVITIVFYEVDGNSYYKFNNWSKWQRVDKPQVSLIPDPDNDYENHSENDSENSSENEDSNNTDSFREPLLPKGKEVKVSKSKVKEYMHFDEMSHIKITPDQFKKLVTEIGSEDKVMNYIYKFASWILTQPEKKQKTASTYLSIINWHKKELEKSKNVVPFQSNKPAQPKLFVPDENDEVYQMIKALNSNV